MKGYICYIEPWQHLMTLDEFKAGISVGAFDNFDGFAFPVRDGKADQSIFIELGEDYDEIPDDATHIVWFNR